MIDWFIEVALFIQNKKWRRDRESYYFKITIAALV